MTKYKQYNLLLDPNDEDELILIKFLENMHGNKRKNSYSAILRKAILLLKYQEELMNAKVNTG